MYILYVLSAIVPSDFFSIEFLLIFYNNCLGFEIISDTQKATSDRWLFITDSIIGNTNDHIAPVFFFTGFLLITIIKSTAKTLFHFFFFITNLPFEIIFR